MNRNVIEVTSLSKRYRLGNYGARSLHEEIGQWFANKKKCTGQHTDNIEDSTSAQKNTYFWALRDVTLSIKENDIVGLIGNNGSGKSTLLKILSRITTPTRGSFRSNGRIASLLEVGTGFHPELSGRENIYLNGAIMGMRRHEINANINNIIEFSGCEKFIDTPVKRYSSGMVVRLGFAISAYLESEIMIVDEVLAVGDHEFQSIAINKMQELATSAEKTIIFVSHNLSVVRRLCSSAIIMDGGTATQYNTIDEALTAYTQIGYNIDTEVTKASFEKDDKNPGITGIRICDKSLLSNRLVVYIDYSSPYAIAAVPGILLHGEDKSPILGSNSRMHAPDIAFSKSKSGCLKCEIDNITLHDGEYYLSAWLGDWYQDYDSELYALCFRIQNTHPIQNLPPYDYRGPLNHWGNWSSVE